MDARSVRRSVIAGTWYPGTAPALRRALDGYFARVDGPPIPGRLLGLISPHAGYDYSGQTAAHGYRHLRGRSFLTVAVLAPSHRAWFDACAVSAEDAYQTPLGCVPVDHDLADALSARIPVQRIRGDAEHAVEIQLPFLQSVLGDLRLLPLLLSTDDSSLPQRLAQALCEVAGLPPWSQGGLLLIASSDLHHISDYAEVVRRDRRVVDALAAYDIEALTPLLMACDCSVCGRIPILTVLRACRTLGASAVQLLHQTNSGDVTGQRRTGEYTVGYVSAAICESAQVDPE